MGVISLYDVAKAVVDSQNFENKMLKAYIRDWPAEDAARPLIEAGARHRAGPPIFETTTSRVRKASGQAGAGVSDKRDAGGLLFYASLFFSRLADQILLFLVPLVVFETTGSVAWSGIAFTLETLPRFLAFPVCGALCDRVSPLKLLRISQLYRALVCIAGVIAFQWAGGVGWLIALSAVCGVLTTQGLMAREVMLPQIFRQHRFEKVLAHAQIADQLGMVLGPLLASLLLRWMPWPMVVGATAVFFLIADGAVTWWHRRNVVTLAARRARPGPLDRAGAHRVSQVMHLPGLKKVDRTRGRRQPRHQASRWPPRPPW